MNIGNGQFWRGDCLELMRQIPDASVDMILCDLPYGTTACKWDAIIPFEPLWAQYWRIAKPNAVVVLTASQPFTTQLIGFQIENFKYCWVWEKSRCANFAQAKNSPLKTHEDICVFSKGVIGHVSQTNNRMTYNPQGVEAPKRKMTSVDKTKNSEHKLHRKGMIDGKDYDGSNYPKSIIKISNSDNRERGLHPTQKPVDLFAYLIRTYTQPGQIVLDNCAGSGTTAIAAEREGRKWLCIEQDETYYNAACGRVWKEVLGL